MYNYKCPFAERRKQGYSLSFRCAINGDVCVFTRYCIQKQDIEHTTNAPQCQIFLQNKEKVVKNDTD